MIETLNDFEISLITKFRNHPLFSQIDAIAWEDLLAILIQRRFLSLSIVNLYEFVIDALTDEGIKRTVRGILNEEFPRNTKGVPLPSHRELLFQDLLNLGATSEMILITPETPTTQKVRNESYQCMIGCLGEKHCQVGLVAFLRFWAEVLVSVEYSCLWQRISERLSNGQSPHKIRSEFYYFHMIHDSRNSDIGQESILGGLTHSQELAIHLKRLISSKDALVYCLNLQENSYQLKCQFYDQFIRDRPVSFCQKK
ncbi:hypothetical protein [Limnofasciculus baicalensis]|uniref:Heme oxygenase n=1 Tax=Limnofasciculus baicalensis BBK-W-15 TaxID=2699891 RepID=A0AAE3GLV8_9CYAN|nr:hypothetical protein [Limnofasciculus baicalensis]MCP2726985.1 hypothetical protein [Limnofasciculus baicalensis BBK-W-15]